MQAFNDFSNDPMSSDSEITDAYNTNPDSLVIDHPINPTFGNTRASTIQDDLSKSRTLVWGILTEPISGKLTSADGMRVGFDEYIPAAVVKFIQQTGAKVVPVSYHLTKASLFKLLDKINGLYLPGDSTASLTSNEYKATFSYIVDYMFTAAEINYDYFPVFMMGNSLQSLMLNRLGSTTIFKPMNTYLNTNLALRLVRAPESTFLFDELIPYTVDEFITEGQVFNKQRLGLKVRDFQRETLINKRYQVTLTFKTSAKPDPVLGTYDILDDEEYVACLESPDFPLYACTYEVQYTQFVHANKLVATSDPLDHKTESRKHAQFIAKQIGDEGRLCSHQFTSENELQERLIQRSELASVVYTSISGESSHA